jgi:hypothetical protein
MHKGERERKIEYWYRVNSTICRTTISYIRNVFTQEEKKGM